MKTHPNVKAPINAVIGADVACKLFSQSNGSRSTSNSESVTATTASVTGEYNEQSEGIIKRRLYLPMDEPTASSDEEAISRSILPVTAFDGDDDDGDDDDDDDGDGDRDRDTNNMIQREDHKNIIPGTQKKWLEYRYPRG